jgi:hypothetical protein
MCCWTLQCASMHTRTHRHMHAQTRALACQPSITQQHAPWRRGAWLKKHRCNTSQLQIMIASQPLAMHMFPQQWGRASQTGGEGSPDRGDPYVANLMTFWAAARQSLRGATREAPLSRNRFNRAGDAAQCPGSTSADVLPPSQARLYNRTAESNVKMATNASSGNASRTCRMHPDVMACGPSILEACNVM